MTMPRRGRCTVCGWEGLQWVYGLCVAHDDRPIEHLFPPVDTTEDDGLEMVTGSCEVCDEEVTDGRRHCPPCRDFLDQELRALQHERW